MVQHLPFAGASHLGNANFSWPIRFHIPHPTQLVVSVTEGLVGSWGLFPAWGPSSHIFLPMDQRLSGWGVHPLTTTKLSDLWNTPLLLQDWFSRNDLTSSLALFTEGIPARVLHAGASHLLSHVLRGGGVNTLVLSWQ